MIQTSKLGWAQIYRIQNWREGYPLLTDSSNANSEFGTSEPIPPNSFPGVLRLNRSFLHSELALGGRRKLNYVPFGGLDYFQSVPKTKSVSVFYR